MIRLGIDSAFDYTVDPSARLALVAFTGTLTGGQMLAAVQTVHADPRWQPGFSAIWDCMRVRAHIVAPEEVQPLLDQTAFSESSMDVLLETEELSRNFFSDMFTRQLRALGKNAWVRESLDEGLAQLGREALPERLLRVYDEFGD